MLYVLRTVTSMEGVTVVKEVTSHGAHYENDRVFLETKAARHQMSELSRHRIHSKETNMSISTEEQDSEGPLPSSDVKVYGYHTYKINSQPKPAVSGRLKALIFVSLFALWQIRSFRSNSDVLTSNLRGDNIDHLYITESDIEEETIVTAGSDDFESATVDPSSSISLDTEDNEENDESIPENVSRATTETRTNQAVETSTNGDTSLSTNPLVGNNGTETISPEEQQYALWKASKEELDAIQPWKNESTFLTVDRGDYQQVVEKAHVAVASVVDDVYTDCEMYILPALEPDDGDKEWNEKLRVQFKCLGDDDPVLRDDLCHTANICRVVLDKEAWKEEVSAFSSNVMSTTATIDNSSNNNNKSVVLMIVDSIEYLMRSQIFKATMNKASYAYRSNRELFIWIGDLDQSELNRREIDSLESTFHFKCTPKELENSMHYYKPIAILALFNILESESIFFIDADADFTPQAFDRIANDKFQGKQRKKNLLFDPIGPESYLDISPQASLLGTQNVEGKMLMNSGLLLLRNTKWSRDLAAMWWYTRCGHKDQLGLWIILYATFSAWTTPANNEPPVSRKDKTDRPFQFAYSGKMFFDYKAANDKLFMHFRKYGHRLQAAWEEVVEQQRIESSSIEMDNNDSYDYPVPTNIKLYNGGNPEGIQPVLRGVLELPHVVILPQASIHFNKAIEEATGEATSALTQLIRFKSEDGEDSFTSHSKALKSCSDGRCWPYWKD